MELTRRQLLRAGGGAAVLAWAGCGDDDAGAVVRGPDARADGECALTAHNFEGPFYEPGAPARMVLVEEGMPGTRLRLSGRVLGEGCAPLAGATLDVWQADADGTYDEVALRGVLETDADGNYEILTIVPGHYLNGATYRPAHIHVKVSAPGHALLTTQLYFEGDPYNEQDAFIEDSLIMAVDEQEDGSIACEFDLVLAPAS